MPDAIRIRYGQRAAPVAGMIFEIAAAAKGASGGWVGGADGGGDG